ncbi:glycosyltransferase family 4 protein [Sphingomonas sp. So64.6b]|uniref:glycosyltransferase family 4 protein n=1 Tax=Sphingomonas sp. So64.6b TaxID=2997354 RepID=UPI0016000D18|nr:glycosyltransferase family 1 protein [Sphingomonas sp. So64.6b]QNA82915.1 glycosyltransferase family 4 protein [Sphingomonas sp. So64.6b]
MLKREFALDVSRLVWRSWSHRLATGIDRVCYAYLENFRERSQAVVQYRGIPRVLSVRHSEQLFDLLIESDEDFRGRLIRFAPMALARAQSVMDCRGAFYLNVGHTDIDLGRLVRWVEACGLRAIYFVHDLIPLTHSEFCNPNSVVRHRGRVMNALGHASGIVTNSEASSLELEQFATRESVRMPPVIGAWLAGAQFEKPSAIPLKAHPHFICVGTIEARKNHFLLLQVWRRLVERLGAAAPKLIIVGQKGAQATHVEGMLERCATIRDHVTTLSHCPDEELGHWMGSARALLMPSFAEGFGLPLVEALQVGTPVIASDLPSFREIGEGIPKLLDPLDAISWEQAILSFLENGPDRGRQLRLLRDYKAPSWKDHFDRVETWLEGLARQDNPDHGDAVEAGLFAADRDVAGPRGADPIAVDGANL